MFYIICAYAINIYSNLSKATGPEVPDSTKALSFVLI